MTKKKMIKKLLREMDSFCEESNLLLKLLDKHIGDLEKINCKNKKELTTILRVVAKYEIMLETRNFLKSLPFKEMVIKSKDNDFIKINLNNENHLEYFENFLSHAWKLRKYFTKDKNSITDEIDEIINDYNCKKEETKLVKNEIENELNYLKISYENLNKDITDLLRICDNDFKFTDLKIRV